MCCCKKPNVNGEKGAYSWDGKSFGVRQPNPPDLLEHDELLYDEPGRCGGLDSHSFHFRIVKQFGTHYLLVRHGGGDERIRLGSRPGIEVIAKLNSNDRYWILQQLYHVQQRQADEASQNTASKYRSAFVEGRLKKKKVRGQNAYKVTIDPKVVEAGT